jgi:hypothetical protein
MSSWGGVLVFVGWWDLFPCLRFFVVRGLPLFSVAHFLSASSFFFFLCIAFPSTVFHPSISTGAVVGASGPGVSWGSGPAGEAVGFVQVGAVASWHGGYLIIRALSASWVAEVAYCECIRPCLRDASLGYWVASHLFVGIVGSLS